MRWLVIVAMLGTLGAGEALAAPVHRGATSSDLSAQARHPPTRFRVYPGRRLLYRDCSFRLAYQWRPSGNVIVPVQRCWWVRG